MNHDYHHIYELCKSHMHSYVLVETVDGSKIDGIVTGLDDEYVYIAVPLGGSEATQPNPHQHMDRQSGYGYGYPGYGSPGYGYPGYGPPGYGAYPPRRFQRLILPLAALTALSVLPWY
ncbi:hypothetical protein J2Z83_001131 [Virgibacillus natechei]|uniref:Phosphatidylinositol kinase n=1 Tax=Virgibacillus natechei TaxID=1216297 RepID=A0ABS4IDM4_9BACI|nr:hypothetical protein [Virgibacillus natechei]MBP1969028.1 hypothetical protein [Virgibacillus natechei]UZD14878.1 hypothetical protein OLD84_07290 [Virgibacillus natechei]